LPDTSGNGEDAVQATGANQPTYNSSGYVTFDGTDDYLANTTLTQAQRFTMYIVANVSADTVAQIMFGDTTAYVGLASTEVMQAYAGNFVGPELFVSGAKKLFAVDFNGASSTLYVNGASVATGDIGAGGLS